MDHFNIPVFIPHFGCPFQCIFCNQKAISGKTKVPDPNDIGEIIERTASTIDFHNSDVELAFFGGSFTCLEPDKQRKYLEAVQPYIANKRISGIRISTRPDFIDNTILGLLKKYNVHTIELGAQSMDEKVLIASGRGHTVNDIIRSVGLIKKHGFKLGIQTMIGLPEDDAIKSIYTAERVIELQPDCVRIYPVLVLKDTELEKMFLNGTYIPLKIEQAVERVAKVLKRYINNDINVIKVGLHPAEEYKAGGKLIAGPYHPAFREMAMTWIWRKEFESFLLRNNQTLQKNKDITITVPALQYNFAIGYKAENRNLLKQFFRRVRFAESESLKKLEFELDYH